VESDLERFEIAAARVHILTHGDIVAASDKVYWQLNANIFRSLACAGQWRAKLLPRLRQLTWSVLNDDVYPYILLFLSPNIKDLDVMIGTGVAASDSMRFSLLASLASQCPFVHSVALHTQGNLLISWRDLFSRRSSGACTLFTLWTGLESLSLQNLDLGPLTDVLVGLPALTKLTLHSCHASSSSQNSIKGFSKLQHLFLIDCNFDSCLHVLKCMYSPPLACINIRVMGAPDQTQWAELFNELKNGVLQDDLSIMSISSWAAGLRNVSLSFQTISPLLSFQHITQFRLYGMCSLDLGDGDIMRVAKAWPRLQVFKICPSGTRHGPSRSTVHALVPFAKYCHRLENLALTIDATAVSNYEEKPGKGICSTRLRELGVHDSPINDPGRVAAFISDVFPNVGRLRVSVTGEDQKRKWKEVEKLIPVFAAVRRQEINKT
jgi:hypothetical protein